MNLNRLGEKLKKSSRKEIELWKWKKRAHDHIDQLWKNNKYGYTRNQMYKQLSSIFGKDTHIKDCDVEQCKRICMLSLEKNF